MSNNNDHIKSKATQFISLVSGLAEKKIHQIVDKGSELSSEIEKGVHKAYHTIMDNLKDVIENFDEKEPGEFENGDLAISPVDIVYPGAVIFIRQENIIRAGEVFEFHERLIPYIRTPLYEPDIKTAVQYARIDELDRIRQSIFDDRPDRVGVGYMDRLSERMEQRKKELLQSSKKKEPTHES
jgi:hypothetical protein